MAAWIRIWIRIPNADTDPGGGGLIGVKKKGRKQPNSDNYA
jgi:hypothetical protein